MNRLILFFSLLLTGAFRAQEIPSYENSYIPLELVNNYVYFEKIDALTPKEMNAILINCSDEVRDGILEDIKEYNLFVYRKANREIENSEYLAKIQSFKIIHKWEIEENGKDFYRFTIVISNFENGNILKKGEDLRFRIYDRKENKFYNEFMTIGILSGALEKFYLFTADIVKNPVSQDQVDSYVNRSVLHHKDTKKAKKFHQNNIGGLIGISAVTLIISGIFYFLFGF